MSPTLGPPPAPEKPHPTGTVEYIPGIDLTDEAAVTSFYEKAGPIWASIHTAGGFAMAPIEKTTKADFLKMFDTNTLTTFLCCREAIKAIRRGNTGGRIVNIAAKAAIAPVANMSAYIASKAAVTALTQSLAEELAPEGIWVNAVLPSIMDTPANRVSFPPGTDFSKWPTVAEVAATTTFLASPENRVTRGALVPVYGRSS
jgi:NAD(P)-dependent dehydrogenase (short-subunit alcohol dehydrogenase family)